MKFMQLLVLGPAFLIITVESIDAPKRRMHGVRKVQSSCIPGTACVDPPPPPPNGGGRRLQEGLQTLYELTGNGVFMSMDASGNTGTGSIQVEKPSATALVRKAILMASTIFGAPTLDNTDIALEGTPWTILHTAVNPVQGLQSYYSDMTSVVQPIIDAQPAGIHSLTVTEVNQPDNIDGEALVVVFSDPSNPQVFSASILFGALSSAGDQFTAMFQSPITASELADPNFVVNLSLGIGYGFQDDTSAPQFSIVDVNGQRLTSFAGNYDDGYNANGGLITIGGIGDSNANPADPNAQAPDDELYNLIPFLSAGDSSVVIQTVNPSNDDIVFFAGIYSAKATTVVVINNCVPGVTGLTLIDAVSDTDIGPLPPTLSGTQAVGINIRADVRTCSTAANPKGAIDSVYVSDNGVGHCEQFTPYSVYYHDSPADGDLANNAADYDEMDLALGLHTIEATAYSTQDCSGTPVASTLSQDVNVVCDPVSVDDFVLYDTSGTHLPPHALEDGECISPPGTINIETETEGCGILSVKMSLKCNGKTIARHIDNAEPWFLFGNDGETIYTGKALPNGHCVLSAALYSQKWSRGAVLVSKTINFDVGNCP